MRSFNHIVLGVALLVGVVGGWTLRDGVSQYVDTSRAFASVTIDYQPGSYVWLEPGGESARVSFVVVNDSPRSVVVESLDVHLYFGEDFAGANYEQFRSLTVPAGETRTIDLTLLVTSQSKLPQAGTTELFLRGNAIFRFDGIQRARGLDVFDAVGVVPLPAALGGGQ